MPLHMRVPKLKGFNNPFRVEYQALNLDTLEATGLDEVTPETLHEHGPRPTRAPWSRCSAGASSPARSGQGPRASRSRPRQPSPPRAVRLRSCRCPGATAARRPRATTSPTASRRRRSDRSLSRSHPRCFPACATSSRSPTCGTRSCSRCFMIALYRFGRLPPGAGHRPRRARRRCKEQAEQGGVLGFLQLFSGGALTQFAIFALGIMPYITASIIMQILARGDPQARAVAGAGRGRPAQDHAVDPLPHDRHRRHAVHRPQPTCSTTAAAASGGGNTDRPRPRAQLRRRPRGCSSCSRSPPAPRC